MDQKASLKAKFPELLASLRMLRRLLTEIPCTFNINVNTGLPNQLSDKGYINVHLFYRLKV